MVLHEIGHGLGLAGTASLESGRASIGVNGVNGDTGVRSLVSQPPTLEELFLRHYKADGSQPARPEAEVTA